MYYEARTHQLLPVANAMEAADKIRMGECKWYQVPTFTVPETGQNVHIVCDGWIDNPKLELAVLMPINGKLMQIESLTNGWMNSSEELADSIIQAINEPQIMCEAKLIVGEPKGNETAWFDCGCCGTDFKGNVKEQERYGQDAGYGICPKCVKYYS